METYADPCTYRDARSFLSSFLSPPPHPCRRSAILRLKMDRNQPTHQTGLGSIVQSKVDLNSKKKKKKGTFGDYSAFFIYIYFMHVFVCLRVCFFTNGFYVFVLLGATLGSQKSWDERIFKLLL